MQSSLTAPTDKDTTAPSSINAAIPPLSMEETKVAVKDLCVKTQFPMIERRFIDPPVDMQRVALLSFIPALGATPNRDGIYGMAKIRYVSSTIEDAEKYAEKIIQTVDSFHKIFFPLVGHPFPLTTSSDFSAKINEVDIRKTVSESVNDIVKKKREEDAKQIEEIKSREEELLKDVSQPELSEDTYTTLKVKKAQLTWTYIETMKKIEQMRGLIVKCRRELFEMEEKDENLAKNYYKKYVDAREKAGLRTDKEELDKSFMRYLVEDVTIPEIDALYKELYENQ